MLNDDLSLLYFFCFTVFHVCPVYYSSSLMFVRYAVSVNGHLAVD